MARAALALAACGALPTVAEMLLPSSALGNSVWWDPVPGTAGAGNGAVNGGSGTWNTATANWTLNGGATNTTWDNTGLDAAIFGGLSGGTVTISGTILASSLQFDPTTNNTSYTLAGASAGDTLTLTEASVTANKDATINATLAGTLGLIKLGTATLTLGGNNTFAGTISITEGKLRASTATALGASTQMSIDGGEFEANTSLAYSGAVDIGAAGASLSVVPVSSVYTQSGAITGGSGATLTKKGQGTLVLSSTSNSFIGDIVVAEGMLSVASDLALGDGNNGVGLQWGSALQVTSSIDFGGVDAAPGSASRVITVGSGGGTLDVTTGATLTLDEAGQLASATGGGLLTKSGGGRLLLGADHAGFSGGITVLAGTVELSSNGAAGSGAIAVSSGGSLVNNAASIGNAVTLSGGEMSLAGNDASFTGPISVAASSTIRARVAGKTLTLSGILAGAGALTIDAAGGSVVVGNPANFSGSANTFTGNVTLMTAGGGTGTASLNYRIAAPATQTFTAQAGTLTLGGSVTGATVDLASGSTVQSTGGIVQVFGRAASAGVGVTVRGNVLASGGGSVVLGDGLDDAAQLQFISTSNLTADNGTIELRPRGGALTLDSSNVGSITVKNGGILAVAGNTNVTVGRDILNPAGSWTLANRGASLLRIASGSQDSTAGLILRAEGGVTRYETDAITIGTAQANGTLNVDLRGGTVDINAGAAGKTFTYATGYTLAGWGQIGTSAANQTHVIPAGGATFRANLGSGSGILGVVGGFNETAGSKAVFRIGDNDGLALTVPNNSMATAYAMGSVTLESQGAASVARLIINGGFVQANKAAFTGPSNKARFEINGGTLVSDLGSTSTLLVTGGTFGASAPILVSAGGSFITTSSTFALGFSEFIGGAGTLFGYNGTTTTALTLNGMVQLSGTIGGSIAGGSTGTLRMDGGNTLTLGAAADLSTMTLAYAGAAGVANLEINAPATSTARIAIGTGITAPYGAFGGTRQFTATSGILQMDAADAATVSIGAGGLLAIDRTADATSNPVALGNLVLQGGTFIVGTTASTTTIASGGALTARGTYGHTGNLDTFINNGTVTAAGALTINAGSIRGTGTYDTGSGNVITLTGAVQNNGTTATQLRVIGDGGSVGLGLAGNYTGGTVIEGTGTSGAMVRVRTVGSSSVNGQLGTGGVSLNNGTLDFRVDADNTNAVPIAVSGTVGSTISWGKVSTGGRRVTIGAVNVTAPKISFLGYDSDTLSVGGISVSTNGAAIDLWGNNGGCTLNANGLAANGPITLTMGGCTLNAGTLSGSGAITRTYNSGTLNFASVSNGFTGSLFTSGGTTNFNSGSNLLGTGSWTFGGGTVNINSARALNGSTGVIQDGAQKVSVNLNNAEALSGASISVFSGTIYANIGNALGTGTLTMAGGTLYLRVDPGSNFGGNINIGGAAASTIFLDRANGGTGSNQNHQIANLQFQGQQLNLIGLNGYGLIVTGAGSAAPGTVSTLNNQAVGVSMPSLTIPNLVSGTNTTLGQVTLGGWGAVTIGQIGGSGLLSRSGSGSLTITGTPLPGWNGTVRLTEGTVNLTAAGALSGGTVQVAGGELNLGAAGALANAPAALSSGFIYANVPGALNGGAVTLTYGTLLAGADNALGNATVTVASGNVNGIVPNALGTANITLTGGVLALRGDASAAMGGSVLVSGTNASYISAGPNNTESPPSGQTLTITSLALGGQTLNITGGADYVVGVANPISMSGTSATTFSTTAADAIFQGALTGSGPVVKNGERKLTLNGGGSFGATTVSEGGLVVNGAWTTSGVSVGAGAVAARLELGGGGINAPGSITINNGTLRIAKTVVSDAVPTASTISGGAGGNVGIEYAGFGTGTLANNLSISGTSAARTLTLAALSGSGTAQASTLVYSGVISWTGTNQVNVKVLADTPLDDGGGNLVRPPSRVVLAGSQNFTTALVHGGGIVSGKGDIVATGVAGPFGKSTAGITLNAPDSAIGTMVLDGQSSATYSATVRPGTTATQRLRLGAFRNAAGVAGAQSINFTGSMTWNDDTAGLFIAVPPGDLASGMANSTWNGILVEPNVALVLFGSPTLDNALTMSGTNVATASPMYIGGGGTVRMESSFSPVRNSATAVALGGKATLLDGTTLESKTTNRHFDAIELRGGTYAIKNVNQDYSGPLTVEVSPFDPTRAAGTVTTDFNLNIKGVGASNALRIAAGQTLVKNGTATLTINAEQLHGAGAKLQADAGTVSVNTDAGGTALANSLWVTANNSAIVNLNVTQHLAQVVVSGNGLVKLASSASTGQKVIEATGVSGSGSGKLDLTNNHLIVDYAPGSSPAVGIRALLASGYNAGGARWTGAGIMSSSAAADATISLGYAEASDILGASGGTFAGQAVDGSAILVRYTKAADATLDSTVNFDDLLLLSQNYNGTGKTWHDGDFTYDGKVDFDDLLILAQTYNMSLAGDPVALLAGGEVPAASTDFSADWQRALISVPEPAGMGIIILGALAGLAPRRRKRRE